MKITLISGSQRVNSQTAKVAKYLQTRLEELNLSESNELNLIDLSEEKLPLMDESIWDQDSDLKKQWSKISEKLSHSDGFIILTPEWNGMATAAIKNFFLFVRKEMLHKPGLLVSVSAGRGGAYPITELRSSSYKNSKINYIPEHLIVREVESVLNIDGENDEKSDKYIRSRIDYTLNLFGKYIEASKTVLDSEFADSEEFGNGM